MMSEFVCCEARVQVSGVSVLRGWSSCVVRSEFMWCGVGVGALRGWSLSGVRLEFNLFYVLLLTMPFKKDKIP